ncbi:MAG: peptide chain release factor N(5)-glutamine methyltransferase [Candidatus Krumholzibacteria bacterium]|nr:peptide chain release factor N(5)-glutamine methyltransferase [Candidatus Krumholzibacteria bacterium]
MNSPSASIRELLKQGEARLVERGVPNAWRNVEWMLCHALSCRPLELHVRSGEPVAGAQLETYLRGVERRARREPLQHILAGTEFMSLPYEVRPGVFVPRPETETLVEETLALLRAAPLHEPLTVLDLGCGTGVIAVSLAYSIPNLQVFAVDESAEAVALTERNADRNGVAGRVRTLRGEAETLLAGSATPSGWPARFTAIVCNPPYIATAEIPLLPPEVRDYDPHPALDGGSDGLDAYRGLVPLLRARMQPGGVVCFEIGSTQREAVTALLAAQGFEKIACARDLAGRDRVVRAASPAPAPERK